MFCFSFIRGRRNNRDLCHITNHFFVLHHFSTVRPRKFIFMWICDDRESNKKYFLLHIGKKKEKKWFVVWYELCLFLSFLLSFSLLLHALFTYFFTPSHVDRVFSCDVYFVKAIYHDFFVYFTTFIRRWGVSA